MGLLLGCGGGGGGRIGREICEETKTTQFSPLAMTCLARTSYNTQNRNTSKATRSKCGVFASPLFFRVRRVFFSIRVLERKMSGGDPHEQLRACVAQLEAQLRREQGKLEAFDRREDMELAALARRKAQHILANYVAAQNALRYAVTNGASGTPLHAGTEQASFEEWMRQVIPTRLRQQHPDMCTTATQTPAPQPSNQNTCVSESAGAPTETTIRVSRAPTNEQVAVPTTNLNTEAGIQGRIIESQSITPTIEKS
jgi:hypothetical protein